MSGHSKWSNIAARKGKQDALRGKIFTKLGREIQVVVRRGGPDPSANAALRDVIAKARANNMSNETINNAIKKASGANNLDKYEEVLYEGYGPNGVAFIVEAMTDNKNRTASEVRCIFDRAGGKLGTSGCVSYMFDKKGVIILEKENVNLSEDDIMMLALDNGAEDFKSYDDIYEIITNPKDFSSIIQKFEEENIKFLEAEVKSVPQTLVSLDDFGVEKIERLVEKLEDLDDVQSVSHNGDI